MEWICTEGGCDEATRDKDWLAYTELLVSAQDAGRAVALDLVRWADAVTESFSPKAMRAWGFDYVSLRQVKPELIMVGTCLMGQSGPLAQFAGFGNLATAMSGFFSLTGWPDRPPAGPFGAYGVCCVWAGRSTHPPSHTKLWEGRDLTHH